VTSVLAALALLSLQRDSQGVDSAALGYTADNSISATVNELHCYYR